MSVFQQFTFSEEEKRTEKKSGPAVMYQYQTNFYDSSLSELCHLKPIIYRRRETERAEIGKKCFSRLLCKYDWIHRNGTYFAFTLQGKHHSTWGDPLVVGKQTTKGSISRQRLHQTSKGSRSTKLLASRRSQWKNHTQHAAYAGENVKSCWDVIVENHNSDAPNANIAPQ